MSALAYNGTAVACARITVAVRASGSTYGDTARYTAAAHDDDSDDDDGEGEGEEVE